MSSFKCQICNATGIAQELRVKEMCKGTRDEFTYMLCAECGTLQLTTPPSNLSYYYEGYYSLQNDILNIHPLKRMIWQFQLFTLPSLGDFILRHFKKEILEVRALRGLPRKRDWSILDVGCGAGMLLQFMKQVGFDNCLGCDPFIDHEVVLDNGLKILKTHIENVEGQFDMVMLHHAYEHVPDPQAVMCKVARLLKPSGYCIVRIPNIASIEFQRYRANWWGIHAPYHTFLYSLRAMELLSKEAGLYIESSYCDSRWDHYMYSKEYTYDIADKSHYSRRQGGGIYSPGERKVFEKRAEHYDAAGIGDWIVYIIRRKT